MAAAKIGDDILSTGEQDAVNDFIKGLNVNFKFGTLVNGPGNIRFYFIKIVQSWDYTCSFNTDDKIQDL